MHAVKIGIVGAGAVSERYHIPAAKNCPELSLAALVDKDLDRARTLSEQFSIPYHSDDIASLYGRVDGVILALPHHLHATVAIEFLKRKIPVLVEKPMAVTVEECHEMNRIARETRTPLAVGHAHRFAPNAMRLKSILDQDLLGSSLRYGGEEGLAFEWPSRTGFFFDRAHAGGGVLLDSGVHTLDWILWFFGEPETIEYQDDNFGGIEANVLGRFTHPRNVKGSLELSRTHALSNRFTVSGTKATISISVWKFTDWQVERGTLPREFTSPLTPAAVFEDQLRNFGAAIRGVTPPAVDGAAGERVVRLIHRCYQNAGRLEMPWLSGRIDEPEKR